jgi:hypothetical protein
MCEGVKLVLKTAVQNDKVVYFERQCLCHEIGLTCKKHKLKASTSDKILVS